MNALPIFLERNFLFIDTVPKHIEGYPVVPTYVGFYALFGATEGNKPYTLAVDVPDEEMARTLAEARAKHQDGSIGLYGYSDDVYILLPNGENYRTYDGRHINDV